MRLGASASTSAALSKGCPQISLRSVGDFGKRFVDYLLVDSAY